MQYINLNKNIKLATYWIGPFTNKKHIEFYHRRCNSFIWRNTTTNRWICNCIITTPSYAHEEKDIQLMNFIYESIKNSKLVYEHEMK